jgi:hypothetical protein
MAEDMPQGDMILFQAAHRQDSEAGLLEGSRLAAVSFVGKHEKLSLCGRV